MEANIKRPYRRERFFRMGTTNDSKDKLVVTVMDTGVQIMVAVKTTYFTKTLYYTHDNTIKALQDAVVLAYGMGSTLKVDGRLIEVE
jgi:hypothetical protein